MTPQIAQAIDRLTTADSALDAVRRFVRDDSRPQATRHQKALAEVQGTIAAALQDLRDAKEVVR